TGSALLGLVYPLTGWHISRLRPVLAPIRQGQATRDYHDRNNDKLLSAGNPTRHGGNRQTAKMESLRADCSTRFISPGDFHHSDFDAVISRGGQPRGHPAAPAHTDRA